MNVDPADHLKLSNSVAIKRFVRGLSTWYLTLEDMQQEAAWALCFATKRYKPEKGTFATYASSYCEGYLKKQWWNNKRIVMAGGARNSECEAKKYAGFKRFFREGRDLDIDDFDFPDEAASDAMEACEWNPRGLFHRLTFDASPAERYILLKHTLAKVPCTQEEIAKDLGVTHQRISQIMLAFYERMRNRCNTSSNAPSPVATSTATPWTRSSWRTRSPTNTSSGT